MEKYYEYHAKDAHHSYCISIGLKDILIDIYTNITETSLNGSCIGTVSLELWDKLEKMKIESVGYYDYQDAIVKHLQYRGYKIDWIDEKYYNEYNWKFFIKW